MNTIDCPHCGKKIELSEALTKDIEKTVLAAEHEKHVAELAKAKSEAAAEAKKEAEAAIEIAKKQLAGDVELAKKEAEAELEIAKKKLEAEAVATQKKYAAEQDLLISQLREDNESTKEDNKKLREDLSKLMDQLRESNKARENAELEAKKKIAEEESKIREEAQKAADEAQRLKLAEKDKQLEAAKKQVEEMQRKLSQGSQQMQGEILELDLEEALADAFRDDKIEPIAKGVNGADISQTVRSQSGIECGVILWELKRTKNWTDGWIPKLKDDFRKAKANIAVIVSEALPKQFDNDMGHIDGVWICRPKFAIVLAMLLRKSLLDVGRERVVTQNRGDKAEALYNFVTSHEFIQQVEAMVETYQEMTAQVNKERAAFEKLWAQREAQAQRLLTGTANIVGSMQGHIGHSSMPKIKGLEIDLLGAGESEEI